MLVLGGDHVYKMDYEKMLADHMARQAAVTVACIEVPLADARKFGVLSVDEDRRITDFHEKPAYPQSMPGKPDKALASMGIYIFDADVLRAELNRDAHDADSSHDFGKDLIPRLVSRGRAYAHHFADSCVNTVDGIPYWRDVGTLDAYWEANMDLAKVLPDLNLYDDDWPIWSYALQLPAAKFILNDGGRRGQAWESLVAGGCIVSGATVQRSVLFSKVRIESHSHIEDSVILSETVVGSHVTLKRAVVDKRCQIPDGLTVGLDVEEDRRRFYVTEQGVTLITPHMLGQQIPY